MSRPAIGVFDSGVGGLTVLRELLQQVPEADYLYFGDTARLPYGSKSKDTVARYAIGAAEFLVEHGAQRLVIACNTATALALNEIASAVRVPAVGVVEPGAQRASELSKSRSAIVIATDATVSSRAYERALTAKGMRVTERACPLLVPLVEEGWLEHPVTEQVAHIYLDELLSSDGADVLVLGCTHYPLLKPLLRRVVPARIALVDSAESTARAVRAQVAASQGKGAVRFFATDSVEKFRRAGEKFLGFPINNVAHVDLES